MLERRCYYKRENGHFKTVYRRNPSYEPWHCFTTTRCKKCGESYEPFCEAEHICEKQNSYPFNESEVEE